jgi:hypothetical protein
MSLLWVTGRIIFRVNIRRDYAGCRSRVVRRRLPRSIPQFHASELIERNAAPVFRRSRRFQTTLTISAVLIAKHPELPFLVPSEPVRTKQAGAIIVNSRNWPPALHGRAQYPVNIGHKPNSAHSRIATHTFRLLAQNHRPISNQNFITQ